MVFKHGWSAPAALGSGFVLAVATWSLMGALIIKQRVPSFIITLGGLLIFKGLFWKVIDNSTVPVSRGDEDNLYALTTYYLPTIAGAGVAAAAVLGRPFRHFTAIYSVRVDDNPTLGGLTNTSVNRATGIAPELMMSPSTCPGPTEGS